jgi:hypothetical protein
MVQTDVRRPALGFGAGCSEVHKRNPRDFWLAVSTLTTRVRNAVLEARKEIKERMMRQEQGA